MKYLGYLTFFIIAILLKGFVLTELWDWFIIPLGLKSISLFHAMGISLLLILASTKSFDFKEKTEEEKIKEYTVWIIVPLLVWLFGYIYSLLM
jgi:hypothetical protein